jgi:hypothetical protein
LKLSFLFCTSASINLYFSSKSAIASSALALPISAHFNNNAFKASFCSVSNVVQSSIHVTSLLLTTSSTCHIVSSFSAGQSISSLVFCVSLNASANSIVSKNLTSVDQVAFSSALAVSSLSEFISVVYHLADCQTTFL